MPLAKRLFEVRLALVKLIELQDEYNKRSVKVLYPRFPDCNYEYFP